MTSEPALRVIMRRLREIMSEPGDGQARLDRIVKQIAGVMVTEVCSIYLKRQDGSLELFATEGLNPGAVHSTRMKRGEGLVGRCAELNITINEPEASSHPAFSYRPETGEEIYHSLLAVPIQRSGQVLGVLVVQNRTQKEYSDEDAEVLQTTAMFVAEHLVSGAVVGAGAAVELSKSLSTLIQGEPISEGIALGHVVLHEPRIVVTKLMAEEPAEELARLEAAIATLRASLDEMFGHEHLAGAGEHRDVLEAYRMFAHDKGWERRLREAVEGGLTAEAAVERVQNWTRARMLRQNDAYWRERQRDLADLSDRLLRILAGRVTSADEPSKLPPDAILVARTMGPAELLDYDRSRLRGLVVEDGSGQSHVAIVAKALGIAAVGQARGIVERVGAGDAAIVDAITGEVHLRPSSDVISAYSDKVRFLARRQRRYRALKDVPAVTVDGERVELHMNAGLLVDLPHLEEFGRRRRRPVPHRAVVHAVEHAAEARAAGRILSRRRGARRRQAGHLPHARHRRRQGAALPAPAEGGEPRHGLAGGAHGARPPGAPAHAGARPVARRGRPRAAHHDPDGVGVERDGRGARARGEGARHRRRQGLRAAEAGRHRRHDRGAVPAVRARCADEEGGLRLRRQQRPDAVHVRRRPHQCARRQPLRRAVGRPAEGPEDARQGRAKASACR